MKKIWKTGKALILGFLVSALAMTSSAFAASETESKDGSEPLLGGWTITTDSTMTDEAKKAFDKATEQIVGVDYEPVALLGTQVVAGTNYCILCRATVVVPDAEPTYCLMYVYEALDGNAGGIDIQDLDIGSISEEAQGETETEGGAENAG